MKNTNQTDFLISGQDLKIWKKKNRNMKRQSPMLLKESTRFFIYRRWKGLCHLFNGLGHKFGAWLHKAEYFAKNFWNKKTDEIIGVGEDMKKSYCSNLGEYIEKEMKGKTMSQIKET